MAENAILKQMIFDLEIQLEAVDRVLGKDLSSIQKEQARHDHRGQPAKLKNRQDEKQNRAQEDHCMNPLEDRSS